MIILFISMLVFGIGIILLSPEWMVKYTNLVTSFHEAHQSAKRAYHEEFQSHRQAQKESEEAYQLDIQRRKREAMFRRAMEGSKC